MFTINEQKIEVNKMELTEKIKYYNKDRGK